MNERLYISEIQADLRYRDRRSVRRWCRNNNVKLISDLGSNRYFVLRQEYEIAKCRNYPKSYSLQNSASNFHLQFQETEKMKQDYQPQYDTEKRMLSIFTDL